MMWQAGLLLLYDDVDAARAGWRKQTEAWRRVSEAVRSGYFFFENIENMPPFFFLPEASGALPRL